MGIFRNSSESNSSSEAASYELGREYAIARRHRDKKTERQIVRQLESNSSIDSRAFGKGRRDYESIPPVPTPRRNRRR